MPTRAIIFAGAGASKAVNSRQFPTTVEFFERLPEAVTNDEYFKFVMRFLASKGGEKQYDIEHVLWALQEFYNLFSDISSRGGPLGFAVGQNILALVKNGLNFGHLPSSAPQVSRELKQTIDAINQKVYDFYAEEPAPKDLASNWIKLIEEARGRRDRLDIFTTNYDSVIEGALVCTDGDATARLDCGIAGSVRRKLDFDYWTSDDKGQDILLTKLHGSLDWKYTEKGIAVGDAVFTGDHRKQAIVYPGFKGTSDANFFPIFHEYLRRAAAECDVLIFIGFAFRDEHINDIFRDALNSDVRIVSINPDSSAELPVGRVHPHYLHDGFGPKAVDVALKEAFG